MERPWGRGLYILLRPKAPPLQLARPRPGPALLRDCGKGRKQGVRRDRGDFASCWFAPSWSHSPSIHLPQGQNVAIPSPLCHTHSNDTRKRAARRRAAKTPWKGQARGRVAPGRRQKGVCAHPRGNPRGWILAEPRLMPVLFLPPLLTAPRPPAQPWPPIPADTAADSLSLEFLPCHSCLWRGFNGGLMNS